MAGLLVVWFAGSAAAAVTLEVGSASTTAGSVAEVAVRMQAGSSDQVAATQNDIVFDPSVVSVTRGDCRINPNIDKTINVAATPNSIRIIIISLERSDPIPATDILYTCAFHVGPDAPDGNIALNITNVGASDPSGKKISASGIGGSIFVSSSASTGGGTGAQPQMAPAAPRAAAPAPAPAQVQPGGAVIRPAVPAGAPPLPQAGQPVGQAEELPTLSMPSTPTPIAAVPTRTLRSTTPNTATPGRTITATPAATAAK
ncbi:MAG TPA: cohesin domain-containing protein, partial [Candidatus Kryptonia bacterium]|nr:cohesin domain-containing protein [Candidatus Kryptonia bacterium]